MGIDGVNQQCLNVFLLCLGVVEVDSWAVFVWNRRILGDGNNVLRNVKIQVLCRCIMCNERVRGKW
jgi:hypothetical protein